MTQNKKIAITGGIGSGKSAAAGILKKHGYTVFSCDEIYGELCGEEEFLRGLFALFPFAEKDGRLDRPALAKAVFSDRETRKRLDAYTHPRIMERLLARMEELPLSFAEVPLLFEDGYGGLFDRTIAVLRDRGTRIRAVAERSGLSEEEILRRIQSQYSYEELPADCIPLRNDGSLPDLEAALMKIVPNL